MRKHYEAPNCQSFEFQMEMLLDDSNVTFDSGDYIGDESEERAENSLLL